MILSFKIMFLPSLYLLLLYQVIVWTKRYFQLNSIDQTHYFISIEYLFKMAVLFTIIWGVNSIIFLFSAVKEMADSYHIPIEQILNMDMTHVIRRNDKPLKDYLSISNSWDMRVAESTAEAMAYSPLASYTNLVGKAAQGLEVAQKSAILSKAIDYAKANPLVTEKLTNAALSGGITAINDPDINKVLWSAGTGFVTGGMSVAGTTATNSLSAGIH